MSHWIVVYIFSEHMEANVFRLILVWIWLEVSMDMGADFYGVGCIFDWFWVHRSMALGTHTHTFSMQLDILSAICLRFAFRTHPRLIRDLSASCPRRLVLSASSRPSGGGAPLVMQADTSKSGAGSLRFITATIPLSSGCCGNKTKD